MAKIDKLQEKLKKIEEQLEKEKEEAHKKLGEELIKQLGIDYELLGTKKEIKAVVEMIINELNMNPFSDESEEKSIEENPVSESVLSVEENEKNTKQY